MKLAVTAITADSECQPRLAMDARTVEDYASEMTEGAGFPPLTVFHDGDTYWLADGFHRLNAAIRAGLSEIDCDVRKGTKRDAVLFSCGANGSHGLRRTNQDKRRAVETLLKDPEWVGWSDPDIARSCGVGQTLVWTIRKSLISEISDEPQTKTYTNRWGNTSTMNVSNIGKGPKNTPGAIQRVPERMPAEVADELFADAESYEPDPEDVLPPVEWTGDDAAAFAQLQAVQAVADRDAQAVAYAAFGTNPMGARLFLHRANELNVWLMALIREMHAVVN